MNVLVNGIGNIGKTILGVLCDYKELCGIDHVYALKNTAVNDWNREDLLILKDKGVIICSKENPEFKPLGEVIDTVHYIFDCNANGIGFKNKNWYESLPNLKGCSAQGSEKGFGIPFMSSANNEVIATQKFVQIVSCNTHAISSLITTIVADDLSDLIEGDFVIVRRSEDIGNHERLVTANVISRHMDNEIGTHHAIDVKDLFKTKDVELAIQSSDITTPSQLMHTVRFNLQLEQTPDLPSIRERMKQNAYVSTTAKFDSNVVFELGRRYSPHGRLFSHAIINDNNMMLDVENKRIKGWAFIPQEGNTIISSVHAFLLQTGNSKTEAVMTSLLRDLVRGSW